jgi:hypothetical protein
MRYSHPRQFARYAVEGAFARLAAPMDVKILNLSRIGLALETTQPLLVAERYVLEMQRRGRSISLEVQVRWCLPVGSYRTPVGREVSLFRAGGSVVEVAAGRGSGFWDALRPDRHLADA